MRVALFLLAVLTAGFTMLAPPRPEGARADSQPFLADAGPVIVADRIICSLANADAATSRITGQDGGISVEVDGTSYWFFADTLYDLPGGTYMISNDIAVSTDADASDCVSMTHKSTAAEAVPLLEALPEELGAWPNGVVASSAGTVHFYISSHREGPAWYIRGIGLGRVDMASLEATRVHDIMFDAADFGDEPIGAPGIVVQDETAYLNIHTAPGRVLLARVALTAIEDKAAYEFWDGVSWSADPRDAQALWTDAGGFNGVSVRWSEPLGKWLAIYNGDLTRKVRVRTADALTGPWSREYQWLDCARYIAPWSFPMCYSPIFHPQYDRDGGRTMTVTLSSTEPYEVAVHEVRLGVAVYQWRGSSGAARYESADPGAGWTREGIAFYASDTPIAGYAAVRRWTNASGEYLYAVYSPGFGWTDGGVAFWTPGKKSPPGANLDFDPVYRWERGAERVYSPMPGLDALGYTRGPAAWYGMCGDTDLDAASDCAEAWTGTDPLLPDTDGDGFLDRPASTSNPNFMPATDNCPTVPNPDQANNDAEPIRGGDTGMQDWTHPAADNLGDACDDDLDNDGLSNDDEAARGTDERKRDTDGDTWSDRIETLCGADPLSSANRPSGADGDGDLISDACETAIGSRPTQPDSDNDTLSDLIEARWGSDPLSNDSDGDGVRDQCEVASVNVDTSVNVIDLQQIAMRNLDHSEAPADINRDNAVNTTDLYISATKIAVC